MRERNSKLQFVIRALLLGLLLLAQATAIAHEADHLANGDNSVCAVCSVSTPLDGPVASTATIPALDEMAAVTPRTPAVTVFTISAAPRAARAPPHHS